MSEATTTGRAIVPVTVRDQIGYREYKLLLRADHFLKPSHFHKFWKVTRRTAKAVGVDLLKRRKAEDTHLREVVFFDTPKFRLYNNGFILRRRNFYNKGLPEPNHELSLRFRNPSYEVAAAVDVRPLLPCIHTIKFKEELLMDGKGIGTMRTIYSHGCELDTPNTVLTQNFETITQVFPALQRAGAKAKTLLSVVNGIVIEEVLVNLGELDFGGKITAKANLAIWRNRITQDHLLGEYAYQIKFAGPAGLPGKVKDLADQFFLKLQSEAADWIHYGTTKTAMIYGLGKIPVTNRE